MKIRYVQSILIYQVQDVTCRRRDYISIASGDLLCCMEARIHRKRHPIDQIMMLRFDDHLIRTKIKSKSIISLV